MNYEIHLSRTKEYMRAKSKLDGFLKAVCKTYMRRKKPFMELMDIKARMVNWVDSLEPEVKRSMIHNVNYRFIEAVMKSNIIDSLPKLLRE